MTQVTNIFIITLVVNIVLVFFGFGVTDFGGTFVGTASGGAVNVSETVIGSVDPQNFIASSADSGDPNAVDFKLIDTLGVIRTGLFLLVSVFVAPVIMALQLGWPAYLVLFVAVPWMLAFWVALLQLIRGVA